MTDPEKSPSKIPVSSQSGAGIFSAFAAITFFVMMVVTLYFGRDVLMPIILALFLAFIIAPLVRIIGRLPLGKVMPVLIGVTLAVSMIAILGGIIGTQIAELSTELPQYVGKIEDKVSDLKHQTVGRISQLTQFSGQSHGDQNHSTPALNPSPTVTETATPNSTAPLSKSPIELAENYLSPILSPFATLFIVFVITIFALLQWDDLGNRLIRLVGPKYTSQMTTVIEDASKRLRRYFITQLCINTVFGVFLTLGLLIIGVPNPLLWGIVSALLRFVPYIGSILSAILPLTLAAGVEPGWSMVLWVGGLYLIAEGITGQIIEPLVYGHSTGLSPFSVVVAAIFWSWLWGPTGLILSTPLTLCLVVIGRNFKNLEFLDILLGDDAQGNFKPRKKATLH